MRGQQHCFGRATSAGIAAAPPFEFVSVGLSVDRLNALETAAARFYTLFPLLEASYAAFFLAQTDVVPVRSGWVEALLQEARARPRARARSRAAEIS